MAATIELTSASSNLEAYLSSWSSGFTSNYGAFWSSGGGLETYPDDGSVTYSQWGAGQSGNKGVVITGSFQYDLDGHDTNSDNDYDDPGEIAPNDLVGTVNSLVLGTGYSQSGSGISLSQQELIITPDNNDPNSLFDYAIYQFTVNSSIAGLYTYLASVGTVIEDTTASNILVGFGGADTFVFTGGNDTVKAGSTGTSGYADGTDMLDISAWGVTDINDLDIYDNVDGNAVIENLLGSETITLVGVSSSVIDSSDFLFA